MKSNRLDNHINDYFDYHIDDQIKNKSKYNLSHTTIFTIPHRNSANCDFKSLTKNLGYTATTCKRRR